MNIALVKLENQEPIWNQYLPEIFFGFEAIAMESLASLFQT